MHADGFNVDFDDIALPRHNFAALNHAQHLLQGDTGLLVDSAWNGTRGKIAVIVILPVGKPFAGEWQIKFARRLFHFRSRQRHINQLPVNGPDGSADGQSIRLVTGRHVVEGAMRLEMRHGQSGILRHRLKGTYLIRDHVLQIRRPHGDVPSAETPQVIETGMHADTHLAVPGHRDQPVHGVGIARVKAARNVGRLDDIHQFTIIADVVGAPAFGNVGVEVDPFRHGMSFPQSAAFPCAWYVSTNGIIFNLSVQLDLDIYLALKGVVMSPNKPQPPRFLASGDTALVVEFGDTIDRTVNRQVIALSAALEQANLVGVIEAVPSYRSLMVHFDPVVISPSNLQIQLKELLNESSHVDETGRLWTLPVCYEGDLAPDLQYVAGETGSQPSQVIELHSSLTFHVYMIGFLPGYPYMGDLPDALALPRRTNPRIRVPPGSLAIAKSMTAVYPQASPGGWHLIGRTPVRLFDLRRSEAVFLSPGDKVRFKPVSTQEFAVLDSQGQRGKLDVVPEVEGA